MRKNLFDAPAVDEIIARAQRLQATAPARWGTMNATEMLYHCNLANRQILDGDMEHKPSTLKQELLRFLSFYIVPKFPKNRKGAARNDTKGRISPDQFDAQLRLFIRTVSSFAHHKKPFVLTHPAFGNLDTRQWGVAAWMHMDHHLRQFGV
ncbi:DUF1569 domain-containing protein [Larkinella bovis]|uniref:DUF1569 domain-containing protein n=1 Tax=Larkinella bovis TaxID=683041 RepID=A0ABW0ICM1_9BACT